MEEALTLEQQQALAMARARLRLQQTDPVQQSPKTKSTGEKILDFAEPTISALGAVGGGALGLASPIPGGTALGAGLGYATANQGIRTIRQLAGYEPTDSFSDAMTKNAKDTAIGGSMEAGGAIVARNVLPPIAKTAGWIKDFISGNSGEARATLILKKALEADKAQGAGVLNSSTKGFTASQALAENNAPTTQALLERAMRNDPALYGAGPLTPNQIRSTSNTFNDLTGAPNRTHAKAVIEGDIARLNERLIPVKTIELNAANTAGQLKPLLDAEAERMANAAALKVEDVRRMMAASERAGGRAHTSVFDANGNAVAAQTAVPGYPRQPGRYTYMGDLEKAAEKVATQAAEGSLPFGEASRFAKSASTSLEAHGLKPLKIDSVVQGLVSLSKKPEFAGNDVVDGALKNVASDLSKWVKAGGVIDARALDAIRQNSVNAAIQQLRPTLEQTAQKKLAAGVLTNIKPLIDDAIEQAGGTGYRQYLKDYAIGRQVINQRKLIGQAQDLFKSNPKEFVSLINSDNPELIEKVFGSGSYNIIKEMSAESMSKLIKISDMTSRGISAKEQANIGQQALRNLLEQHDPRMVKIPWGLSPKTMALNKALDVAERRIGRKTMESLTNAAYSPESFMRLLKMEPSKESSGLLKFMLDAPSTPGFYVTGGELTGALGRQE